MQGRLRCYPGLFSKNSHLIGLLRMPLVDLSFGDALDRLSVLLVKKKFLSNSPAKLELIEKERSSLSNSILDWCIKNKISLEIYEKNLSRLVEINELGWHQIELVRESLDENNSSSSLHDAHVKMISINDDRIKAKNTADDDVNYKFKEVKSYL